MPYLGDYLGQLLSEISMARMQADLETVRLAELYASHPLLRTMPIPHLRLPNVELDVPVLIKQSEEPRAGESARGGLRLPQLRGKFDEVLDAYMAKSGVQLSAAEKTAVDSALEQYVRGAERPTETSIDTNRIADDFVSTAARAIGERKPELSSDLKEPVRTAFLQLRSTPPRLLALVTSAEIREAGNAENITRLHLKISEEGVEWTSVETNGARQDRLIPE